MQVTYNIIDQPGIFEMGFWWKKWFSAVLIMLVFLISTVHALEYDEITIESDREWMTAGGDPAVINVTINNESVSVQSVDFSLSGTGSSGTFSVSSDTASPWKTSLSSEESGIAYVQVTVNYIADGYADSVTKEFRQNIDHDVMDALASVDYEYEVTVNEAFPITISAVDRYGNLIDSRKEDDYGDTPESFELISSPETSEFWDGSDFTNNTVRVYVNSTGYAETLFRVSEIAGTNFVSIYPSSDIDSVMLEITGLANAEPADIVVTVSPASGDPPYQPADGVSKFYVTYWLFDQWGNPSGNRHLYIEPTNPGESSFLRTSNSAGKIEITYGPQVIKGIYTLVATSVDNTSISEETDLEFVSTDPTDMLLTANPQVMPSHDVDDALKSALRAKVIDEKGNPVMGETVTFSIIDGEYPDSQLAGPYLESSSAISDQDGQAIVNFIPGTFETDWVAVNYSKTADASCQIRAQWNTTIRYLDLEWKNYPYLTVKTNVTPETVKVNDTVAVTIQLIGDGWALQPDPIDVMLTADRSGSMLLDEPDDRMVSLMDALKVFADEMNEGKDRLGLTSFGVKGEANIYFYGSSRAWAGYDDDDSWDEDSNYIKAHYPGNGKYYSDHATIDLDLTFDFSDFDNEVDGLVPYSGTPMRKGLYYSIEQLKLLGRNDGIKAVVLLSDGDYTWYGDPLARGDGNPYKYDWGNFMQEDYTYFTNISSSEQDMRVFANNNNIKIYSIAFGDGISNDAKEVLRSLAEDTGGEYYNASKGDQLEGIYEDIAGELKEAAGVDTEMELMFQNVELNNENLPNTGSDPVLEYVYDPEKSTLIESFYGNGTYISEIEDQSAWWAENRSLHFDVGTVYLNQTWQATYTLKIMKAGNINLFNDTSYISFNNGEDILELPKTFVTSVADLNSTGVNYTSLDISCLKNTNSDSITNTIDLEWNLDYDGEYTVSQNLYYLRIGDNVWINFNNMTVSEPVSSLVQSSSLPVVDLPPGEYRIRVIASAYDAADDKDEISSPISVKSSADAYIKIE